MDSLKEIYEAFSQRIKSPILGYIFLSFIGFNWKPLYFLFFSSESALTKFEYFDSNTSVPSLLWLPLVVGLIAALAAPHISNLGAWWAIKPINAKRLREVSAAHEVLQEKNKLLAERENEKALFEQALINEAKRDQEIKEKITDEDIKAELEDKIESSRTVGATSNGISTSTIETPSLDEIAANLRKEDVALLKRLADAKSGKGMWLLSGDARKFLVENVRIASDNDRRQILTVESALKRLTSLKLLEYNSNKAEFLITQLGYDVVNHIEA